MPQQTPARRQDLHTGAFFPRQKTRPPPIFGDFRRRQVLTFSQEAPENLCDHLCDHSPGYRGILWRTVDALSQVTAHHRISWLTCKRNFLSGGQLWQQYCGADAPLGTDGATAVVATSEFGFSFEGALLTVVTDQGSACIALRSVQGEVVGRG